MSETLGVAEAKRRFSELIERVGAGERIVVARHGRPVMALIPPGASGPAPATGRPTGFATLAGALGDVDGFAQTMDEVVASRGDALDRPAPDLS